MKNREVAELLYNIGELLELKGENPFKIRAYSKAARAVENLSADIEEIRAKKELQTIQGIGAAIAKKIDEYLRTGRLEYYEELSNEIPRGLKELLKVPGIGPKTIQIVYQEVGTTDMDSLEKAAKSHKLQGLPGFGETKEENIIKAIKRYRERSGRIPLGKAYSLVEEIFHFLQYYLTTGKLVPAGSMRRGKDTVGDIDLLAIHDNPFGLINAFVSMPPVAQVLGKGTTKASIVTKEGVQVDLRILEARSFGTSIQYFTGSKEHNVKLRNLAQQRGYKLSEYELEDVNSGEKIYCLEEEELYRRLGLQYIPPELREDTGEIEAASQESLPDLLSLQDLRGDLHVHTNWSDGKDSMEDMTKAAKNRGYSYIGITDHSKSLGIARGLSEERLLKQIDEIHELNDKLDGFTVFAGIEVDIRADATLDFPDKILENCDFVVAAVHSAQQQDERTMTGRIIKAMENPNVDILAHPSGRLIGEREPYLVDMEAVLEAARRTGTILEINAFPARLDLIDVYVRRAKDTGIRIAIGTDAHSSEQLDLMRFGVTVARRGWLEKKDVINTLEVDKLQFKQS
ncbi:MAG: DNA polymerase/3'-5' exonuclease PolX [Syntrophales bacterium]|nr:DNA polymerase/3'-5' exonuclease PolX [Syntrophales bacterium]